MLGEHPADTQPNPVALLDTVPDEAVPKETKDERSIRDQSLESTESRIEAPASASQIYHAALLNNRTFDDLLAAFQEDEGNRGIVVDQILVRRNPKTHLSAEWLDAMDRGQRYRSLGTHSATEGAVQSAMIHETSSGSPTKSTPQRHPRQPESQEKNVKSSPSSAQANNEDKHREPQDNPDSHTTCEHPGFDAEPRDRTVSLQTLNRCPTFVRRHAQSLLPKRLTSGDKHSLAMLKERGAMSTPVLSSPTPTKQRARLQRKVETKAKLSKG
jgi:hypothetical protein